MTTTTRQLLLLLPRPASSEKASRQRARSRRQLRRRIRPTATETTAGTGTTTRAVGDPRRDSPLRRAVAAAPTREAAAAEGPTPLRTRQCFSVLTGSSTQLIPKTEPRAQTACRLNSRSARAPRAGNRRQQRQLGSCCCCCQTTRQRRTKQTTRNHATLAPPFPRRRIARSAFLGFPLAADSREGTNDVKRPLPPLRGKLRIFVVGLAFGGQTRWLRRGKGAPLSRIRTYTYTSYGRGDSHSAVCVVIQPDVRKG